MKLSGFIKHYLVCLITIVITLVYGVILCINGETVSWTEGVEGGPGGNPYMWKSYMFVFILLMVVLSLVGLFLRNVVSKKSTLKGYCRWSFVDAFLVNPLTTVPFAIFLCGWLVLGDFYNILPTEGKGRVPPLGFIIQMTIEEVSNGRLFQAMLTTGLRNGVALLLACFLSIVLVLFFGENRKLCQSGVPLMRCLALVPPLILFTYAAYLDQSLFMSREWEWILMGIGDSHKSNVLSRAFGQPGRLLLLSSVAIWPLLITGLSQYHKVSESVNNEIKKYRLPYVKAVLDVKLRYVLSTISPAFYIAIVLVFVVCVAVETAGGTQGAIDGVANYYMDQGVQTEQRARLVFGVCVLMFLGLFFLGICDVIISFFCGVRHIPKK